MRVLLEMNLRSIGYEGGRAQQIHLFWQDTAGDLDARWTEVLTFDGATQLFARARAYYEKLWAAGEAVEDAF